MVEDSDFDIIEVFGLVVVVVVEHDSAESMVCVSDVLSLGGIVEIEKIH